MVLQESQRRKLSLRGWGNCGKVCVCRGADYTDNILQFTSKPFYKTQLIHKLWFEHLKVWCHSFIFPAKIEDVSSWIPRTCWTMNKESLPSRTLVVPGLVDQEDIQTHSMAGAGAWGS